MPSEYPHYCICTDDNGAWSQWDVINSTLLAQLASNKKFPGRPLDKMKEWHESYGNILAQLGWSMRSFEYVH